MRPGRALESLQDLPTIRETYRATQYMYPLSPKRTVRALAQLQAEP